PKCFGEEICTATRGFDDGDVVPPLESGELPNNIFVTKGGKRPQGPHPEELLDRMRKSRKSTDIKVHKVIYQYLNCNLCSRQGMNKCRQMYEGDSKKWGGEYFKAEFGEWEKEGHKRIFPWPK
ncbi:MAG: hypothetical protein ACT4P5_23005, partial [Armatimonadota bacterium]